jgi:hypothetical protein
MRSSTTYSHKRYEQNCELLKTRARAYYRIAKAADPVMMNRKGFDRTLRSRHGITLLEWEARCAKQGGCCALCGEAKPLRLDHDHKTKVIRGMLCARCNTGLGHFGDTEAGLLRAVSYLRGVFHVHAQ